MTLIRKVAILLMVVVMVAVALPVWAQGGLSAEEEALVERMVAIFAAPDDYDSYVDESVETQNQALVIAMGETAVQEDSQLIVITSTTTIDRPNNAAARLVKREVAESGTSFVLEGELRFVDDTLYATAAYTEGEGFTTFPEGWTVIEDVELDYVFFDLEPKDLLDSLNAESPSPFEDIDLLKAAISSISSEEGEWEGAPVEIITAVITGDGIFSILASQDESFSADGEMAMLLGFMDDDSGAELVVYVDENDAPVHAQLSMQINITDLEISEIDPSAPAGFTVTLSVSLSQAATISQVNAVSTAITAP